MQSEQLIVHATEGDLTENIEEVSIPDELEFEIGGNDETVEGELVLEDEAPITEDEESLSTVETSTSEEASMSEEETFVSVDEQVLEDGRMKYIFSVTVPMVMHL